MSFRNIVKVLLCTLLVSTFTSFGVIRIPSLTECWPSVRAELKGQTLYVGCLSFINKVKEAKKNGKNCKIIYNDEKGLTEFSYYNSNFSLEYFTLEYSSKIQNKNGSVTLKC